MSRICANLPVIFTALLFLPLLVFGWEYIVDLGGGLDDGRDVALCADGGLFITGRSNGWAYPDGDFAHNWFDHEAFLIKLNANGEEEWINHYGQTGWFIYYSDTVGYYDAGWSVFATPDSGCIIAGKSQSPNYTDPWTGFPDDCPGNDNLLVVRVDKNGDTLWTRGYGGYNYDRGWCIVGIPGTDDFFIVGPTASYGDGMPSDAYENIWILRINAYGDVVSESFWADETRGGHTDARWCCITPDGGCLVVGDTDDHDTTYTEGGSTVTRRICKTVIIKTDSLCNILWSKIYDRGYFHYSRSVVRHPDGGYLVLTYDKDPSWTWILHIDEDGDTIWTTYIGTDSTGTERYANYRMVVQGPDDGFYFAGAGDGKARILYTDKYCNKIWEYEYDYGPLSDLFLSCVMTPDSGCFAAGQSYSRYPYDYSDIYAGRVNRWGEDFTEIAEPEIAQKPKKVQISAHPNPFNSSCVITANVETAMAIYDIRGRIVANVPFEGESAKDGLRKKFRWTPDESTPSGMYFVRAIGPANSVVCTKRIVYLK